MAPCKVVQHLYSYALMDVTRDIAPRARPRGRRPGPQLAAEHWQDPRALRDTCELCESVYPAR